MEHSSPHEGVGLFARSPILGDRRPANPHLGMDTSLQGSWNHVPRFGIVGCLHEESTFVLRDSSVPIAPFEEV